MKRYLLTIPIFALVLFFAFFGGVSNVGAQGTGNVTPQGATTVTHKDHTKAQCDAYKNPETRVDSVWKGIVVYNEQGRLIDNTADCIVIYPAASASNTAPTLSQMNGNDPSAFQKAIDAGCTFPNIGFLGCALSFFYYIFYSVPALLLIVAAKFFNVLMMIVLQRDMYDVAFIKNAWSVVRDLSNIFFILALLYIAIKTVLGMGGHETKKTITSVVLMALLINFSMFFSRIVIDSSNILALIFYNRLSTTTNTGQPDTYIPATKYGEKDLSRAIYTRFNAAELLEGDFLNKLRVSTINGKDVVSDTLPFMTTSAILFISGIILFVATYVFFSSGIYFIGRLIELWLLMIFSPFAFMSYAFAPLKNIDYIGWETWSKKIISSSFAAPLFMFFLYLIFLFLEKNIFTGLIEAKAGWIASMLNIFLPAAIILGMLLKAKDFAKKGGGQFGEMAMSAAKVTAGIVGGLGLGTTAVAGRFAASRFLAGASRSQNAVTHGKALFEHSQQLEQWQRHGRAAGLAQPVAPVEPPGMSRRDRRGAKINASQLLADNIAHARHEEDEIIKKAGLEGINKDQLTGAQLAHVEATFIKEKRSEIESEIRKGYDGKGKEVPIIAVDGNGRPLVNANGQQITAKGENDFKQQRRGKLIEDLVANGNASEVVNGQLTDEGRKRVEDKLNSEFNMLLKNLAAQIGKEKYQHIQDEAKQKIGLGAKIRASAPTGSYDLRNVLKMGIDKREGFGAKTAVGLITAVAAGIRMGFKQVPGINYGSPQRDYFKDIKDTISDSLKNAKVSIDLGGGKDHGGGGHDDGHGGGHGTGGGH